MHAPEKKKLILFLGDIAAAYLALFAIIAARFGAHADAGMVTEHLQAFSIIFVAWALAFFVFNLYELEIGKPRPGTIGIFIAVFGLNALLGVTFFYLAPWVGIAPKSNLLLVVGVYFGLLFMWRRVFYYLFETSFRKMIVFYGASDQYADIRKALAESSHVGVYGGMLDSVSALAQMIPKPDLVVVPEHVSDADLEIFSHYSSHVKRASSMYETMFGKISLLRMDDARALRFIERGGTQWDVATRIAETIIASIVLFVTAPLLLLACIAICIEDGRPFFYSQARSGKSEKPFMLYKLRSMRNDAERDGVQWAAEQDSRVTRVGRILRKTHIDEIPQFWNIIKGELALVGPRPERPEFVAKLKTDIPYYFLRHVVKPGFTGWAQIKYRYARTIEDSREKFEYDLYYLKNKGPLLNLGIIIKTVQIIFTH